MPSDYVLHTARSPRRDERSGSNGRPHTRGFDPDGRLTVYPIGSDTRLLTEDVNVNGVTRSFDADGRLSAYPIGSDTRVLSYDLASRITGFGQTNSVYNRSFSYDPEDRLLTYQDNLGRQTYSYDTTGNRTGIDYGATAYPYTVAATSNRLTKVAGPVIKTYLYDAAGNPTSDGVITFTWDAANRLNKIASGKGGSAVSASYLYNGLGQRLLKTANVLINAPWRYVYDEAGHLIGEYDKNNAVLQETVWLGDTPVAVVKQTAPSTQTIYFVQADHLNTPRVILNSTNTPAWRWDNSDAFGVGQPDEDPDKDTVKFEYNPRFPGQYFDKETNLHYNGFRDYEPRTGRYVESDPIGLAGGLNLYGYVDGNPLSYVDPLGLCRRGSKQVEGQAAGVCEPDDRVEPDKCANAECGAGLPPVKGDDECTRMCKSELRLGSRVSCFGYGQAARISLGIPGFLVSGACNLADLTQCVRSCRDKQKEKTCSANQ